MLDIASLKKILVNQSYITKKDAVAAEKQADGKVQNFLQYLYQEDLLNQSTLGLAIAEYYKTTFSDLGQRTPSISEITLIPPRIAKKYRVVLVKKSENEVVVATDNPDSAKDIKKVLEPIFPNHSIQITFSFSSDVTKYLSFYTTELNTRFSKIIKEDSGVAPELFNEIIKDAILYRSSDIHFEPRDEKIYIRFRVDGMLRLAGVLGKDIYTNVLNRIKLDANLRTDEHFAPQDGAIRFVLEDKRVDLRVSIVPVVDGEKVVIRVLAEYIDTLNINQLGLSDNNKEAFDRAKDKPFGMIIVTGPTGSGKTTTLYTLLHELNRPELNITTIEDPVEYYLPGINQIQVNNKTGVTFARGLRSIVRQDPDTILLGEIRDTETAETAINAALTGHKLLSTFHANNAASTIPRLLDMGVEPFLLASTLDLVVGQRLVRQICRSCRASYSISKTELTKNFSGIAPYLAKKKEFTLYKGEGCAACNQTGYNGRVAIFEAVEITPTIEKLIAQQPSATDIWNEARKNGAISMAEDGIKKAMIGITTLEEVFRVAELPE